MKSRRNASFLIFKASILKEVSIFWHPTHLNRKSLNNQNRLKHTSIDNQVIGTSNQLTTNSIESHKTVEFQITWISHQLTTKIIWITPQLRTNSLESQNIRNPNHLNLTSTDNQNHLNHTSVDNQITWIIWHPDHLNLKSIDNQLIWISNRLTTKSLVDNHITWSSNQQTTKIIWSTRRLTTKSFDSQLVWIWHQLTFEPLELRTPLPIGSLSLETSAAALCGRYVIVAFTVIRCTCFLDDHNTPNFLKAARKLPMPSLWHARTGWAPPSGGRVVRFHAFYLFAAICVPFLFNFFPYLSVLGSVGAWQLSLFDACKLCCLARSVACGTAVVEAEGSQWLACV